MSSKARGIGPDSLGGLPVELPPPAKLVELMFAADRVGVVLTRLPPAAVPKRPLRAYD